MKRLLVCGLLVGTIGISGTTGVFAQEGQVPRGYLFFTPRTRPGTVAEARFTDEAAKKPAAQRTAATTQRTATAKCCGIPEDPAPPTTARSKPRSSAAAWSTTKASGVKTASASAQATFPENEIVPPMPILVDGPTDFQQVTWGTLYGLGYGYPAEGYSPGYPGNAFGRPTLTPLHGWRTTYDWYGHTYSMHCYCADGHCPEIFCPGYRGACYKPGWNDAPAFIFERHCGRGSCLDGLWHMGGYERPCAIYCPYLCDGPPRHYTYGFPRGTAGDPNFHPKQPEPPTPQEKYADPIPPALEQYPLQIPEDIRSLPKETPRRSVPPLPGPQEPPTPKPQA